MIHLLPQAFKVIMRSMDEGVIVTNGEGKIVEMNPAALRMLNITSGKILGKQVERVAGLKMMQLGEQSSMQEIEVESGGMMRSIEVRSNPLQDSPHTTAGWLILLNDVTDKKLENLRSKEDERLTQTILKLGTALAKSLDFNQVLDLILEQLKPIVPYDAASVMLVENGYARIIREQGYAEHHDASLKPIGDLRIEIAKSANLRQMADTKKPLNINNIHLDPDCANHGYDKQLHSWLGAPIISSGRVTAFLALSKSDPAYYSEKDVAHLEIFANQVAMALENALLYSDARDRITELSILNEIGRTISLSLDLDELLQRVHQQVGQIFDATNFMVAVHEKDVGEWEAVYLVDQSDFNLALRRKVGEGLTGYIIQNRKPLVFHSLDQLLVFEAKTGLKSLGKDPQSWMGVPLIRADEVVGVMAIEHFEKKNLYGEKELTLFSTIGAAVATAIENVRLYQEMQERTAELAESNKAIMEARAVSEALRLAGEALSSTLDFDQVLDLLLEQIKHIIPHDAANIYLIDGNEVRPIRLGGYESPSGMLVKRMTSITLSIDQTPNIKYLIETKKPLAIPDTEKYPGWIKGKTFERIRSWLGAPLIFRDQVVGLISLVKFSVGGFSSEHAETLEIFAGQSALAMENARLFEEVKRFAITDALSGLYNRTYFSEQLDRLEKGRHYPVSIVMADIDNLKEINDTLGHPAGDELIRQAGRLLVSSVRVEDTVARIGGDEFAVLLPGTDDERASQIMKRIQNKMHALNADRNGPPLWLSLGFATGDRNRPLGEVLKDADRNMYHNKKVRRDATD